MATLTPLSASFRAIPLPMPREDPVIRACRVLWAMSTSLSTPSGVSGKGPSPRGNPGRNFGPGPLLAATMRRKPAVVNPPAIHFSAGPTSTKTLLTPSRDRPRPPSYHQPEGHSPRPAHQDRATRTVRIGLVMRKVGRAHVVHCWL